MHYYKRNIGDYAKKAARLTMLQHGAYTLLMDSCYDREEFPTLDMALDWCWASSKEEIEAVEFVLRKFFTEIDGVFVQERIKEELDNYHKNAATNKRIAQEREAKRKDKSTNRERTANEAPRTDNEAPPNHKPITNNQEPLFNGQQVDPDDLFNKFWLSGIRKVGKKDAEKKFKKLISGKVQKTEFTEYLIKDIQWRLTNGQLGFAEMHPSTYLNGERWTDEKTRQPSSNNPTDTVVDNRPDLLAIARNQ